MMHYGTRPVPLVVCAQCGHVEVACSDPHCGVVHPLREVPVCGVCSATGGEVDLTSLEEAPDAREPDPRPA